MIKLSTFSKKSILILVALLFLGSSSFVQAQESTQKNQSFEWEASISQMSKTNLLEVLACDLAVRYKFSDHFSAGFAIVPSCMMALDQPFGGYFYAPIMASFRYDFATLNVASPYFILDAGGSFIGLEGLQGRFGVGVSINAFDNCSLFTELGISTLHFETAWVPISVGIRF